MFNVRLAGGHLYGKQLFTWLSLVVSLMASFVLSFFPLCVLDEIWDLIESVSEGFLTYSSIYLTNFGDYFLLRFNCVTDNKHNGQRRISFTLHQNIFWNAGLEIIKHSSCSNQLSMKF